MKIYGPIRLASLLAICFITSTLVATPFAMTVTTADDKQKAEEVISKHLESIGSSKVNKKTSGRIISGSCKFTSRNVQVTTAQGPAVLASVGAKSLIGFAFGQTEYPHDKLGFDGKELTASYIKPGVRSVLGDFLLTHKVAFKEGLIGGTLSTAWPLLNLESHSAKLEYIGTKKINDREAHVLKYNPRGGSDLQVKIYIDEETYRHVRTEYERFIPSQMGKSPDQSAGKRDTRYTMVEDFTDFKDEKGLMLPHTYKLELTLMGQSQTGKFEWVLDLSNFEFDQTIEPASFIIAD
jgi:hypothetical protein